MQEGGERRYTEARNGKELRSPIIKGTLRTTREREIEKKIINKNGERGKERSKS